MSCIIEIDTQCCVCYENFDDDKLECGHDIHMICVVKSGKNRCPLCRQEVVIPDEYLDQLKQAREDFNRYIMEDYESDNYMYCVDTQIYISLMIIIGLSISVIISNSVLLVNHFASDN